MTNGEWRLLELVASGDPAHHEQELRHLCLGSRSWQWGYLLEQGALQKILPTLAWYVVAGPLRQEMRVPDRIDSLLARVLDGSRQRLDVFCRMLAPVVEQFEARNIPYVFTKGMGLQGDVYPVGARHVGDVDIMVRPESRDEVAAVLRENGFAAGLYDRATGQIRPHDRRELILYAMSPDHLPVFSKATSDVGTPAIRVDVANSLTWTASNYDLAVAVALDKRDRLVLEKLMGWRFEPAANLLFCALHLFREAWLNRWQYDVDLRKFGDIVRLWRKYRAAGLPGRLRELIAMSTVGEPLLWVCTHTDSIFQTDLAPSLFPDARLAPDFVNGAKTPAGELLCWSGDMRARLQQRDLPRATQRSNHV
jgi:hypothetical protein